MAFLMQPGWSEATKSLEREVAQGCAGYGAKGRICDIFKEGLINSDFVIPAKVGIQKCNNVWFPASAGTTPGFRLAGLRPLAGMTE
jgi:hypothetical protein